MRVRPSAALKWLTGIVLCAATAAHAGTTPTTIGLSISAGGIPVTAVPADTAVSLSASVLAGSSSLTVGQVAFCDASAPSCTDIHRLGLAQITPAGVATLKFIPGPGTHNYKAIFLGSGVYARSASLTAALVVVAAGGPVQTTVGIQTSGRQGNYSLLGTVATNGLASPTGTVSFLDTTNANYAVGTAILGPTGVNGISFRTSYVYPTPHTSVNGSDPQVAVADFNGDGIPDIVVADQGQNAIDIFLGKGDGTFSVSMISLGASFFANEVVTGDFNGDGKADFAAHTNSGGINVWLGNGDGTFTLGQTVPNGGGSLVTADFDGDGIADLAFEYGVVSGGAPFYFYQVLHGNGDGTFSQVAPPTHLDNPPIGKIIVADFNGDGVQDIALIDPFERAVKILLGVGDGTFIPGTSLSFGLDYIGMAAGDLNGDGIVDLIVCNQDDVPATVFLGKGDGTFAALPPDSNLNQLSVSIAVADFNGDGIPDLIFPNEEGGYTSVFLGKGDGTFTADAFSPSAADFIFASLAIADFNGDGQADIVEGITDGRGIDPPDNQVDVLLSQAPNTAAGYAYHISPVGTGIHYVEAMYPGDVNNASGVSNLVPLLAVQVPTKLTLTAIPSGGSSVSQPVTLTATLDQFFAQNHYASGSVMFTSGTLNLGSASVINGVATLTTTVLPAGTDKLTATYPGDTNFVASTASVTEIVNPAVSATTLVAGPNPAGIGQTVTLTSGVTGGGASPTGAVTFYDGGTALGAGALDASGHVTYTTATLTLGTHALTSAYAGNAIYPPSTSPAVSEIIETAGFTMTLSSPSVTLQTYRHTTTAVTLTSYGDFGDNIGLNCGSLPTYVTCIFTPNPAALTGNGTTVVSFYLDTSSILGSGARNDSAPGPGGRRGLPLNLALMLSPVGLLATLAARRKRRRPVWVVLVLASLLIPVAVGGCGRVVTPIPSAAPGVYTIPIKATGSSSGITHTAQLTLTVTP